MIKIEDILFWISIIAIIGIALWLLKGSPTEVSALVALAIFVASSEIALWKRLFELDKKAAISYTKVRDDLAKVSGNIEELKNLIKRK